MSSPMEEKKNINRYFTEWKGMNALVVNEINTMTGTGSTLVFKKKYQCLTQACLTTVWTTYEGKHRITVIENEYDYLSTMFLLSKSNILLKMKLYEDQDLYTQDDIRMARAITGEVSKFYMGDSDSD